MYALLVFLVNSFLFFVVVATDSFILFYVYYGSFSTIGIGSQVFEREDG